MWGSRFRKYSSFCHQLFIYHHLRWIVVCLQTLELILMWDSLIPAQAIITRPDSPNFKWAAGLSRNLQFFSFKFGQIRWANCFGFEESVLECFSCFYKYKSYSNVCTWVHLGPVVEGRIEPWSRKELNYIFNINTSRNTIILTIL